MKSPLLTFHSGLSPFTRYWEERENFWWDPKASFPAIDSCILFRSFWTHFTHENVQWNRIFCLLCPLFTCHISWQIRWRWSGSYIVCVHSQREGCKSKPCYYISTIHCILHVLSLLDFSISLGANFPSSIMFSSPLEPMQLTRVLYTLYYCTLTRPFSPFPFSKCSLSL